MTSVNTTESNKERVLRAASELLLDKGLAGLNVRAIAQRAGLSTIAIYSHFQGKQGVLDALYMEGFDAVHDAMEDTKQHADPREAAIHGCQNYLRLARENEAHYRLIFGERDPGYEPSDEAQTCAKRAFNSLVDLSARQFPAGTSRKQHQQAAMEIWALLHGFVSLRHHVIGELLDYDEWQTMVMQAVTDHLSRGQTSRH